MDNSTALWFSEEGMEDTFLNEECDIMDYLDEVQLSFLLEENIPNFEPNFSISNSNSNSNSIDFSTIIPRNNSTTTLCTSSTSIEPPPVLICTEKQRPAKQRKTTKSPMILTFGNPTTVQEMNHQNVNNNHREEEVLVSEVLISSSASFANLEEAAAVVVGKSCDNNKSVQKKSSSCAGGRKRPQSQTYDHILAERKRREQLSQQFVALSTLVPGLKKMDKTSVLGDAINYLKHLQERVKTFEEKSTKQTMESLVILKKSQVFVEDEGSSDEMSGGGSDEQTLPEIEAKVCEKSVLLKVLCHRNKGVLVNLLTEIERLNLCVTNTNVAQFGTLALDITIIAEMEQEFNMTIKDLIIHLQSVLQRSNEGD